MERGDAITPIDPRQVVTPLRVDAVVDLLGSLNLLDDWQAVVDGLRNSFDVGATAPIPRTVMYQNHSSSLLVSGVSLATILCFSLMLYRRTPTL